MQAPRSKLNTFPPGFAAILKLFEGFRICRGNTGIGTAMKRCPNQERTNMKTKILLLGAVVTAFAFTALAVEPLLSPRAAGNQTKIVKSSVATPAATVAYVDATPALLSPRAQAGQTKVVKGMNNDVNPAPDCTKNMAGSPKMIAECASHPGAPMPCCNLTDVR
jgi:hypothetical protein